MKIYPQYEKEQEHPQSKIMNKRLEEGEFHEYRPIGSWLTQDLKGVYAVDSTGKEWCTSRRHLKKALAVAAGDKKKLKF